MVIFIATIATIIIALTLAIIGFIAIFDYLAMAGAAMAALFVYSKLDEGILGKIGSLSEIVLSVLAGFFIYKAFLGLSLIVPLVAIIIFSPTLVKLYAKKLIK